MGIEIDELTEEQKRYLEDQRKGTKLRIQVNIIKL